MWNPWRVRCPYCKASLQMSRWSKIATVVSLPIGLLYGSAAVYMEETGRWTAEGSYVYFAITVPLIIALGYFLWPLTRFSLRDKIYSRIGSASQKT